MFEYEITRSEKGGNGFFTVKWSPIEKADKYSIASKVPSIGGIVELYFMDEKKKLNLFCVARSWYGGIRSKLRELTDEALEKDPYRLEIITKQKDRLYFRWSHTESMDDMTDILWFFMDTYSPGTASVAPTGRYAKVFVKEINAEKIVTT